MCVLRSTLLAAHCSQRPCESLLCTPLRYCRVRGAQKAEGVGERNTKELGLCAVARPSALAPLRPGHSALPSTVIVLGIALWPARFLGKRTPPSHQKDGGIGQLSGRFAPTPKVARPQTCAIDRKSSALHFAPPLDFVARPRRGRPPNFVGLDDKTPDFCKTFPICISYSSSFSTFSDTTKLL